MQVTCKGQMVWEVFPHSHNTRMLVSYVAGSSDSFTQIMWGLLSIRHTRFPRTMSVVCIFTIKPHIFQNNYFQLESQCLWKQVRSLRISKLFQGSSMQNPIESKQIRKWYTSGIKLWWGLVWTGVYKPHTKVTAVATQLQWNQPGFFLHRSWKFCILYEILPISKVLGGIC